MPAYSLAIFDFDGTLADSFPWFCTILNQIARRFGFREVAPDEIEGLRALGTREIVARLGVPAWKMPMIAMHMRRLSAENASKVDLFSGAAEMLGTLAAHGVKVAVVSSNGEALIRAQLGSAAAHVSCFNCGSSLWGKARKFKAVLRRLDIAPAAAIAIGDEIRDIEAARSAGIAAGAVTFGYNTADALRGHRPELVFDTYAELVNRLVA
jgi:phosphoglycolate phosphatase